MVDPNDHPLKNAFIRHQLLEGIDRVFDVQRQIADTRTYYRGAERRKVQGKGKPLQNRTGELRAFLDKRSVDLFGDGERLDMSINYPLKIRFLDMKKHGNLMIYNRQLWGIMYTQTLRDIKYGFAAWLKDHVSRLNGLAGN